MNGRNTYEFLIDEGLIPNYAFPEKGVTLRSVIYRRREPDAGEGDGYDHEVYEYEPPPSAALGELAPENEFYAGARHVSITRIDTRVSGIEVWRLCRSCAYCEKLEPRDDHTVCPRCGDPMWSDEGQRHNMLPLRLVHAAAEDRRSRIVDDRDDREPLFYTRHLVADFEPNSIEQAYAVANPNLPFGFEYIRSATFREMNFGRVDDGGQPTMFAGRELPRTGFRICRDCGTVQGRHADSQEHTRNCGARGDEGGEAIVDCLYLYREFNSEAVRMLLPISDVLGSEQRVASFIAALELGLRRRFPGGLDHIRAMTCDHALSGANLARHPTPFADLFLALPVRAIANRKPDDMAAVVHLHDDETSREDADYRPVWNGVLRLFNLLQFLPNAWWTTRVGVQRTVYPEFARAGSPPPSDSPPEGWEEAIDLASPELRPAIEHWSRLDLPVPEAGFELAGPGGRVIAEAELGWPERKVAVLLPDQQVWATPFEEAGWNVLDGAAENLAEAIAAILVA